MNYSAIFNCSRYNEDDKINFLDSEIIDQYTKKAETIKNNFVEASLHFRYRAEATSINFSTITINFNGYYRDWSVKDASNKTIYSNEFSVSENGVRIATENETMHITKGQLHDSITMQSNASIMVIMDLYYDFNDNNLMSQVGKYFRYTQGIFFDTNLTELMIITSYSDVHKRIA